MNYAEGLCTLNYDYNIENVRCFRIICNQHGWTCSHTELIYEIVEKGDEA